VRRSPENELWQSTPRPNPRRPPIAPDGAWINPRLADAAAD
jgi:hypothetical protein